MLEWLKSLTIEDIVVTIAFIAGAIGGITTIWTLYSKYRQKRRERDRAEIQAIVAEAVRQAVEPLQAEQAATKEEVKILRADIEENNIQTARLDLMTGIEHTPHEHEAILKLGTNYFLKLGGDAWMSGIFRKWSEQEGVDISYIAERAPHLKG